MKKVKILAVMGAIMLLLSSCGTDELVGTWDIKGNAGNVISFYEDGTYELKYYSSTESVGDYTKIGSDKVEISEDESTKEILKYKLDKTNGTIEIEAVEN